MKIKINNLNQIQKQLPFIILLLSKIIQRGFVVLIAGSAIMVTGLILIGITIEPIVKQAQGRELIRNRDDIQPQQELNYTYHERSTDVAFTAFVLSGYLSDKVPFVMTVFGPNPTDAPRIINSTGLSKEITITPVQVGDYTLKVKNLGNVKSTFDIEFGKFSDQRTDPIFFYALGGFGALMMLGGVVPVVIGAILLKREKKRQSQTERSA